MIKIERRVADKYLVRYRHIGIVHLKSNPVTNILTTNCQKTGFRRISITKTFKQLQKL